MKHILVKRPGWDEYFINIARVVSSRGNCLRRQVAAVIVKDRRIISTGYNGTPSGIRNCYEGGCPRCASKVRSGKNLDQCICAHAEENAIIQAANYGVALRGAVLYCTESPCLLCAKMIISAGIKKVIYENEYHFNRQVVSLFREAGVACKGFARKK
ncbi:cytidine/deoxycytidylate deaminase family protein [Verrucomicrobiota bacterium]